MKTRKRKYTTTILATALLFSLGGCVKDELHDTPHPDTGKVTVTVDWSDRGEGVDIPAVRPTRRTIFSIRAVIPLRCITLPTTLW